MTALAGARLLRAIHLHRTPAHVGPRLQAQFGALAARFAPVTEDDVASMLAGCPWEKPRPPLLVALFNGYREHAEVAAPILDRVGLVGWFFVVTAFAGVAPAEQAAWAAAHGMPGAGPAPPDGRLAMSWEEVGALAERHVVASHTRTHRPLTAGLAPAELDDELAGSRRDLEAHLRRPVRAVATFGAAGRDTSCELDGALRRSGYELVYAKHAIQHMRSAA